MFWLVCAFFYNKLFPSGVRFRADAWRFLPPLNTKKNSSALPISLGSEAVRAKFTRTNMIFPDQYKCFICKKRYYGCKRKPQFRLLSCSNFVVRNDFNNTYPKHLGLFRCLLGYCPKIYKLCR